jgi:hypothetical protein
MVVYIYDRGLGRPFYVYLFTSILPTGYGVLGIQSSFRNHDVIMGKRVYCTGSE